MGKQIHLIETTESCTLCEKVGVSVISREAFQSLLSLPNTMNDQTGLYEWRVFGLGAYALVPRAAEGTKGNFDCYLCIGEDDLDDIGIIEYTELLIRKVLLQKWNTIKDFSLTAPISSHAPDLKCWKFRHSTLGKLPDDSPDLNHQTGLYTEEPR